MSGFDFDYLVIGAGSGGVASARRAASYGAKVAIVESVRVGGTCVLRGCVPKKLLVYGTHFADEFADAAGYGWDVGTPTLDWAKLIAAKNRELDRLNAIYIKMLNDSHGHLMGDRVLREVGDIFRRAVRIFDVCARYGGEEFAILMPGANAATAFRIAERIRRQIEQHFVSGGRAGGPIPVTVSVGVASAQPATTRETLIAHADSALFQAKARGKNVVCVYP